MSGADVITVLVCAALISLVIGVIGATIYLVVFLCLFGSQIRDSMRRGGDHGQ
jgi:hypothetical protein